MIYSYIYICAYTHACRTVVYMHGTCAEHIFQTCCLCMLLMLMATNPSEHPSWGSIDMWRYVNILYIYIYTQDVLTQ